MMMKTNGYSLLLNLSFLLGKLTVHGQFIKARANIESVNELRNVVTDQFIPSFTNVINQANFTNRDSIVFFDNDFGILSGTIEVDGLIIDPIRDSSQIQIQAYRLRSGRTEVLLSLGDVLAFIETLNVAVQFTPTGAIALDCGAEQSLGNSRVTIEDLSFRFDMDFVDGNLRILPKEASLANLEVDINVEFSFGLCNLDGTDTDLVLESFAERATELIQPILLEQASLFLGLYFANVPINEPQSIDVGEGAQLVITPNITRFAIDATNSSFDVNGGTEILANLSSPEWRAGRYFVPEPDFRILRNPISDRLFNMNLGLGTINNIIQSAWYLVWSGLAQEEVQTSLCRPIPSDPCPFPPIRAFAGFGEIFGLDAFLLRIIFIIEGLFFTSFEYQVTVPSPRLIINRDDEITVEAGARARIVGDRLLLGRTELLSIDARIKLDATVPVFNSTTNSLSGLELTNLQVLNVDVGFLGIKRFIAWLFTWKINWLAPNLINFVINNLGLINLDFLGQVNALIDEQLSAVPLTVPPIPFEQAGLNVTVNFVNVRLVTRKPENEGETAFLGLGGDIDIEFTEVGLVRRQLESSTTDVNNTLPTMSV